jgi:hypothetical protein
MPPDNPGTVAAGSAVEFPDDGPSSDDIVRVDNHTFLLANIGTYSVSFSVSVTEAGQLVLELNGAELPQTVYGGSVGNTQITGEAVIQTTSIDELLTLDNPSGESTALTITPSAGGADPVVASLTIEQLS